MAEAWPGDVFLYGVVEGEQGAPDLGRCWWLVGLEQWSEDPVANLGIEDRDAEAVGGEGGGVGARDSLDQAVEANPQVSDPQK